MKKYKDWMDTTNENRVYNIVRKKYLESNYKIHCASCPYHKNENAVKSQYSKCWKRHRKTQYKVRAI
jgi:hypothetical protein